MFVFVSSILIDTADMQTLASSILLPYLFYKQTPYAPVGPPGSRMMLWTRAVIVTSNLFFIYTSLRYLTLSESWMVNSCTPFPTAILCWYFLSERFTRIQGICCGKSHSHSSKMSWLIATVLSIVGVLLVTNPLSPGIAVAGSGNIDDHISTEPIYKLLGLGFAIPSTLLISTEGKLNLTILAYNCSRHYAYDGGSSGTCPGIDYSGYCPGHHHCLVSYLSREKDKPDTNSILVIGQITLVWPRTVLEWILLVGTVVRLHSASLVGPR